MAGRRLVFNSDNESRGACFSLAESECEPERISGITFAVSNQERYALTPKSGNPR